MKKASATKCQFDARHCPFVQRFRRDYESNVRSVMAGHQSRNIKGDHYDHLMEHHEDEYVRFLHEQRALHRHLDAVAARIQPDDTLLVDHVLPSGTALNRDFSLCRNTKNGRGQCVEVVNQRNGDIVLRPKVRSLCTQVLGIAQN